MAILQIKDLAINIPVEQGMLSAVRNISLSIERGECLGIVGESGSGKSLTALSILGLLPRRATYTAASMKLDGDDLLTMSEADQASRIRGKKVGFIFQEPMTSLNPVYSIGRQLIETAVLHGVSDQRVARVRAIHLLERVGIAGAERRLSSYPHELSGGQRQRIMIAMALMNQPKLLIADEPTTALDVTVQKQILDLLDELRKEFGMSLMLISHNLGAIAQVADRVSVMYAGEIVEEADAKTIFTEPHHPYTLALLNSLPDGQTTEAGQRLRAISGTVDSFYGTPQSCCFSKRCDFAMAKCLEARPDLVAYEGRKTRCILDGIPKSEFKATVRYPVRRTSDQLALAATAIKKTYLVRNGLFREKLKLAAVRDVSLTVQKGETLAIVGESGCGKSTVARMLLGLEKPDSGDVRINGVSIDTMTPQARARKVQLVFQDPYSSLNPSHTVRQIVRRPLELAGNQRHSDIEQRVEYLLDKVGLPARLYDASPGLLSGGQRQRVAIARALSTGPELIVCDEPTSALDVSIQAQILNLLLDLRHEFQLSLVLITHDLSVVAHMADKIAVMYLGVIVEQGVAEEVLRHPRHPYTQALLASTPRIDGSTGPSSVPLTEGFADPTSVHTGCGFANRCPYRLPECSTEKPSLQTVGTRLVSCHLINRNPHDKLEIV